MILLPFVLGGLFPMAYSHVSAKSGKTFYLHVRNTVRGEKTIPFYFFAGEIKPTTADTQALDAVPSGYVVTESEKTGLPLLKRG